MENMIIIFCIQVEQNKKTLKKMSKHCYSLPYQNYQFLQQQYPGIKILHQKFTTNELHKLNILSQCIKYNVPKYFLTHDLNLFQQQLVNMLDFYYQQQRLQWNNNQHIIREHHRGRNYQHIRAREGTFQQPSNTIFEISEIRRFIKSFNQQTDLKYVNPHLIQTLNSALTSKKQKQLLFQPLDLKPLQLRKKQTIKYTSLTSIKSISQKSQKNQIIITLGNKIPIQVREMRNYVKNAAINSFSVTSIKDEQTKTDLQKQKIHISLCLNKVAQSNLLDIFDQLQTLIISNKYLAQFLIQQTINKCINQQKMTKMYLSFLFLFTKIYNASFQWHYDFAETKQKINNFHKLLIEKLQSNFISLSQNPNLSYKLKSLGHVIGMMTDKKKICKKIYYHVYRTILQKIMKITPQSNIIYLENYYQCLINLMQSFTKFDEKHILLQNMQKLLSTINNNNIKQPSQTTKYTVIQLTLLNLTKHHNLPTSRIKCLLQNLFQKKYKISSKQSSKCKQNNKPLNQQQPKQNTKYRCQLKQLLDQQNGIQLTIQYYKTHNKCDKILTQILLASVEGVQHQIDIKISNILKYLDLQKQQFLHYWSNNYLNFIYQQCDFPFMIPAFSKIIRHFFNFDYQHCIIQVSQCEQCFQDINYFMKKLSDKLHQEQHK